MTSRIGLRILKKQKGKYAAVDTPSTPDMYAPHVFHGTSTEVTVPESSTARESVSGARPRRSNSPAEHAARQDVRHVLVSGDHVEADAARVDREDQLTPRSLRG